MLQFTKGHSLIVSERVLVVFGLFLEKGSIGWAFKEGGVIHLSLIIMAFQFFNNNFFLKIFNILVFLSFP